MRAELQAQFPKLILGESKFAHQWEGGSQRGGSQTGLGVGTLRGSCFFAWQKMQGRGAMTEKPRKPPELEKGCPLDRGFNIKLTTDLLGLGTPASKQEWARKNWRDIALWEWLFPALVPSPSAPGTWIGGTRLGLGEPGKASYSVDQVTVFHMNRNHKRLHRTDCVPGLSVTSRSEPSCPL